MEAPQPQPKRVTVFLAPQTAEQLRVAAAKHPARSQSAVVTELICQYLQDNDAREPDKN